MAIDNYDIFKTAKRCAVDIETKDPKLLTHGPGVYRKDGYICGVAFAAQGASIYLDIAHPDTSPETREQNEKIIQDLLAAPNAKIFANGLYDMDWLVNGKGWKVAGHYHDIQYAEPLLNEYRASYSVDTLARIYGEEAKGTELLETYCQTQGWETNKTKAPAGYIWQMPAAVVREYAKIDARITENVLNKQMEELERQGLMEVYDIECRQVPLLLLMRKNGVRLDLKRLSTTAKAIADKWSQVQRDINKLVGYELNPNSTHQIAKYFDAQGISYPRRAPTELMAAAGKPGNPHIDKNVLGKLKDTYEIAKLILDFRHYDTLISTFLLPYLDHLVDARLHCLFNPLRSDNYGTVSGRYSSTKPNLQQVPAAKEDSDSDAESILRGQIIRSLFIPEEECIWAKNDYSQIEYRIMAHYALGPGSDELRAAYNTDPRTDFHRRIEQSTGFDRRTAKRLNFGGTYGMGWKTAAELFGWTYEEAAMYMDAYHAAAPYIRPTRQAVMRRAVTRGYVFTKLGRRARTHPSRKESSMFNRLIQGTAADVMKKALADSYDARIYNTLIPHLTVHDELDTSVPRTKAGQEALTELTHIMENAVKFHVPIVVDCHTGNNWAEAD